MEPVGTNQIAQSVINDDFSYVKSLRQGIKISSQHVDESFRMNLTNNLRNF